MRQRNEINYFDYKDFKSLQKFVNPYGQIESRKKTGLSAKQQRELTVAIKRARHLALLPFVARQSAMLGVTDLKKDTLVQLNGVPYRVTDYAQKQMGRGGSIVNVKLKNLLDGSVIPKTFKGNEKVDSAEVTNENVQFLYREGAEYFFMNQSNYEQFSVDGDLIGSAAELMNDGIEVVAKYFESRVIAVELPIKISLKVLETPDVTKGDTQSTVQKEATLETGAVVQVPIFIKPGDSVVVDTRDSSYVERAK